MFDNTKTFRKFAHFENKVPMKRLTEILPRFLRAAPAPHGLAAREAQNGQKQNKSASHYQNHQK